MSELRKTPIDFYLSTLCLVGRNRLYQSGLRMSILLRR
jgi:hypothetical protein